MSDSLAQRLADLPKADREKALSSLSDAEAQALLDDWEFWARPEQLLPPEPWSVVWYSGGRGGGKTRSGAEGAARLVRENPNVDGGIVAPTFQADALRKCVEGESGLLRILRRDNLVEDFNRSEGVIYLRSGHSIFATGADNGAIRIQGENLGWCWLDEPGLFKRATWRTAWEESITFAVRKSPARIICTGTPKAGHPLVKMLEEDDQVHKRRLPTIDNIDYLDADWAARVIARYKGTRLGSQELEGILISEVEGALWTWANIERHRLAEAPRWRRVVVGVDPSGGANEIGIVAAGLVRSPCPCGKEQPLQPHYGVVDDRSLLASPERWARAVADCYADNEADRVVAEPNFGGDMVSSTIRVADASIPVKLVTSSRGKAIRAEPVSALSEQGRLHMIGVHPDLETELTTWVAGDDWSPNRLDAVVIAVTELIGGPSGPAEITVSSGSLPEF